MIRYLMLAALLVAALPAAALAGPMEIPEGAQCYECGMKVDPGSPYAAEIVQGGKLLPFCDIGDMLVRYAKMNEGADGPPEEAYVRDEPSGRWIDAREAFYVKSGDLKTPMGWGIAASESGEAASRKGAAMTLEEALEAVR